MKKEKLSCYIAVAFICLGVLCSFFSLKERFLVEQEHKTAALLLDLNQVIEVAQKNNEPLEEVLNQFSSHIDGVVYKEKNLADFESQGIGVLKTGLELQMLYPADAAAINSKWNYFIFQDKEKMEQVARHIQAKCSQDTVCEEVTFSSLPDCFILGTSAVKTDLSAMGFGFDAAELALLQKLDLAIVSQIRSWEPFTADGLDLLLEEIGHNQVIALAFNDANLPGVSDLNTWPESKKTIAQALTAKGIPMVAIEFSAQKGIESLAEAMDYQVLRLHSIVEKDMATMVEQKAVDRFQLATSERSISLAMVRFFPKASVDTNIAYLDHITAAMAQKGISRGIPVVNNIEIAPSVLTIATAILAVAACGYLLLFAIGWKKIGLAAACLGAVGLLGLLVMGQQSIVQKITALGAVVVFPCLSLWTLVPRQATGIGKCVLLTIEMTAFSLLGAVLMVGVLSQNSYMLHINQFMGVKLAHALPILVVLAMFFLFAGRKKHWLVKLKEVLDSYISVKYAALCVIALGVVAIFLMRTGNDAVTVSELELSVRSWLDNVLFVRPRTKEFLLGQPFLMLLCYVGYREGYLPFLLVATIGQVSLVNTFAHIHTPLSISLLRTVHGLWIGIAIGFLFIVGWTVVVKIWQKAMDTIAVENQK